jgi:hypothetical protein
MARFLSITFNYGARVEPATVKTTLDAAKDWAKYAPNCWIIWTEQTPEYWYGKLKPLLHPEDLIFIVEINVPTRAGWIQKTIVEWFVRDRSAGRPGI